MKLDIHELDPEWTVWAKCPDGCGAVTHSCCEEHLVAAVEDHVMSHLGSGAGTNDFELTGDRVELVARVIAGEAEAPLDPAEWASLDSGAQNWFRTSAHMVLTALGATDG